MSDAYDEAAAEIMRLNGAVEDAIDDALEDQPDVIVCCGFKPLLGVTERKAYVLFVGVAEDGSTQTLKLPTNENIGAMLAMAEEKAERMLFQWKVKLN